MPAISSEDFVPWVNYHLSVGDPKGNDLEPQLQVERLARVHASDLEGLGIERFAATAEKFWTHLESVKKLMAYKHALRQLGQPPKPFPMAMTGRGWSFSDIIGAKSGEACTAMLILDGLSGTVLLSQAEKAQGFGKPVALVGGGTRLRELAEQAERHGLAIVNSGTHLGTTIAGAAATASHGSRLGHGGLQNMVHGMHLITGIGESVWIERKSRPVLSNEATSKLNPSGAKFCLVRNDEMFEDALVNLGCMGIVNAVAVELETTGTYERIRLDQRIDQNWLNTLANGDWDAVGRALGKSEAPVFYELTIDPHAWNGPSALHIAYFAQHTPAPPKPAYFAGLADVVGGLVWQALAWKPQTNPLPRRGGFLEMPVPMEIFLPFSKTTAQSVFEHYRGDGEFQGTCGPDAGTWKDLHPDEITGGYPGSLWNASYAIARTDLPKAIPAICAAVAKLPRSFVFTVRFVSNAEGTLAFTRFPETVVIEIDGLSPWICSKVAARWIAANGGNETGIEPILKTLRTIRKTLPVGGDRVARALRGSGIEFSNHWAKLGTITPQAVHAAFGNPSDPDSKLARWRATRDTLLSSDFAKAIFWNWGAVRMGVLERPDTMPKLPQPF